MKQDKRTPTKRTLSRQRIIKAAIGHADKKGMEGLNMRVLASHLGAGVMSLYSYVENKDDLIEGMVEEVAAEILVPPDTTDWRAAIFDIAVSANRTFYRHPWVTGLWSSAGGPVKLRHQELILKVLREAGFSVRFACRGYHAITMHIVGFSMQALEFPSDARAMKSAANDFLARAKTEDIPYFMEHIRYHYENPEPDGAFEFALDMILDGLETILAGQ